MARRAGHVNVLGTVLVLTGVSFVWLMVACTILRIRGRADHWPEWAANTIGSGCLTAYWILRAGWNGWLVLSALTTLGSAWLWRKWRRRRRRRRAWPCSAPSPVPASPPSSARCGGSGSRPASCARSGCRHD